MARAGMEAGRGPSSSSAIAGALQGASSFALIPYKFMVSWNGVLVLVFRGFPPCVGDLKRGLDATGLLPKENPGSVWPKVSLGCLKDKRRLTPDDLRKLTRLCADFPFPAHGKAFSLVFDRLHLTLYERRSHERVLADTPFALGPYQDTNPSHHTPSKEELKKVDAIFEETQSEEDYWYFASKDGHGETHYRGPCLGSSLIVWLGEGRDHAHAHRGGEADCLQMTTRQIQDFEAAVERELPGLYSFFDQGSLHVTLRGIT